ncbi:MAG TPA: PIG-L family deacetylase [Rhodothermales bacterium]|nr:PIG-L family deacetylase [Rhodothermales bacterium]
MRASESRLLEQLCGRVPGAACPRVAVVSAHPDDEVIGAGSRLPRLRDVIVVQVTDGAPRNEQDAQAAGFGSREAYARARREELVSALGLAGIGAEQTREVGLVDQEASHHLAELAWTLAHLFRRERPEVVVTHPYEGGHPDHDATAFAVHAARGLLGRRGEAAPVVVEMASYHNSAGSMATCTFLPNGSGEVTLDLEDGERALKERMMACFTSQQETLRGFPRDREAFRLAPGYDFSRPPHEGVLLYEMFDWGLTGEQWRSLAEAAGRELKVEGLEG